MKDRTWGVAIKKFVLLKPKMYSFLVGDSSEHKKAKDRNKNAVAAGTHGKQKDVLLNKKCLRQSMNRTQSSNYKIGIYEINKVYLSRFDDKIYPKQWI